MKVLKISTGLLFALLLVLFISQNALAGDTVTPQFLCEDGGGTWSGLSAYTGECTQVQGSSEGNPCEPGQIWVTYTSYLDGEFAGASFDCFVGESSPPVTVNDSPVTVNDYSHNSGQGGDAPVGLCTQAAGHWRCSYFDAGTCADNCYIDPHLPAGPHDALPDNVITTLYINVSPDPGGPYIVCFENPDNESLTIYQYIAGAWVPVAVGTSNPLCASASGDGSFYFGS